ncbi:MAG: B12-binding domain-containing radical SAM protein, partial [bacterium]
FRPPAEANSLIFQVTLGCSWNKCAFCEMYTSKQFKAKKEEEVIREIKNAALVYPDVRKIFLADGNAMMLSTRKLLSILSTINKNFPRLHRVSTYALPKDISSKSLDELVDLKNAGLKLLYVGIESGDDEILKLVNKGETYDSTVEGLLKAKQAGIKLSVMIINGLAGLKYSKQHVINSAKILNEIQPEFASTLTLMLPYGLEWYKKRFAGIFIEMNTVDLMKEMELFIENTELISTIFRSNHASNYLVLKGTLSRDKKRLLQEIRYAIDNPKKVELREEWERGF